MKQRILVTGSKGLIGSLLVKRLHAFGLDVVELDNRFPSNNHSYGDICDKAFLAKTVASYQGIVHLAAVSRVVWGEQNPQRCWDVNVEGTHNVLEAAIRAPHKPWLIYASSREVYGQQTVLPVREDVALAPLNVYARSKVAAENLVNEYRQHGLLTAILRFSSVYGSSQDYMDRVVPAFCSAAVYGHALQVDGFNNLFDFTHVSDTVTGIIAAMQKLQQGVDYLPALHLTTGQGTSLLELVSLIERTLGQPLTYQEAPARTYDVHRFYGDVTNAKKTLAWEAKTSLQQGITDLLMQYQAQQQVNTIS